MKILGLIIGLCLVSSSANADFSGSWLGTGMVMDNNGWNANCSIEFALDQTTSSLVLQGGNADCGSFSQTWNQFTLSVQGQSLFWGTELEGTITATDLIAAHVDADIQMKESYEVHVTANGITFKETLTNYPANTLIAIIQGDLKRR